MLQSRNTAYNNALAQWWLDVSSSASSIYLASIPGLTFSNKFFLVSYSQTKPALPPGGRNTNPATAPMLYVRRNSNETLRSHTSFSFVIIHDSKQSNLAKKRIY